MIKRAFLVELYLSKSDNVIHSLVDLDATNLGWDGSSELRNPSIRSSSLSYTLESCFSAIPSGQVVLAACGSSRPAWQKKIHQHKHKLAACGSSSLIFIQIISRVLKILKARDINDSVLILPTNTTKKKGKKLKEKNQDYQIETKRENSQ